MHDRGHFEVYFLGLLVEKGRAWVIRAQLTRMFNRFSHTPDHLPSHCLHCPFSHEFIEVTKGS